jgi:hypothetical protein
MRPLSTRSAPGFQADVLSWYARRRTLRDRARRFYLRIARVPRRLLRGPPRFEYALLPCADSFRGHMRELLSRKWWGVDLGPFYDVQPDGSLQEHRRTKIRKLCIESIIAAGPWANMVDLEIPLAGFDWGERFARDNPCIQPRTETWASSERREIVADGTGPQAPKLRGGDLAEAQSHTRAIKKSIRLIEQRI